ncbi:DnaT-like ssDNA-binding domain-containing protein [Enterobacter hormaechei]|uniref:DnaT-like ssDNA-binding domain-containing protein n=1 Tax=Enterobacter hormaechei TaxID=158836 RepID=UPI00223F84E6|nr:DnaT-like ssDNA-binding domain-containing protein [Enterobacter hormaechei]
MANQWLRLWHDMPNDPKWRTIARISGQPIALVQAVYVHLLVSGSQNVTRGHVDVTNEDLASHFDVTECDIDAVINAMQGRVLDGEYLTGWERRQPKKEDRGNDETGAKSATQRKREQRERQRIKQQEGNESQQCHDKSRNVTTDKEEIKRREDINKTPLSAREEIQIHPVVVPGIGEPIGKFTMHENWQPSDDFVMRARMWGHALPADGYKKSDLIEFITYWMAEGNVMQHVQWEQKFARLLMNRRKRAAGKRGDSSGDDVPHWNSPEGWKDFL